MFAGLAGDAPIELRHVLVGAVPVAVLFELSGLVEGRSKPYGPALGVVLQIGADVADFDDGGDRVLFAYIPPARGCRWCC